MSYRSCFSRLVMAAGALLLCAPAAHATQYFTGGAGWFDFSHSSADSANFMGEWRGNPFKCGILPVVGATVNTDGGVYGYVGVHYDWEFSPNWVLTPGIAAGVWSRGSSFDLGGTVEFNESLELDYKFAGDYRAGVRIAHLSNASLYDYNPGANSLMATFSVPISY